MAILSYCRSYNYFLQILTFKSIKMSDEQLTQQQIRQQLYDTMVVNNQATADRAKMRTDIMRTNQARYEKFRITFLTLILNGG